MELNFTIPKGYEVTDYNPCVYTDYKANINIFGYNVKPIESPKVLTKEERLALYKKREAISNLLNLDDRYNIDRETFSKKIDEIDKLLFT